MSKYVAAPIPLNGSTPDLAAAVERELRRLSAQYWDGLPYYVRTAAEISASVTPTNYAYAPGHAWRYGADPTGATNATTALYNMYKVCIGDGTSSGCDGYIPPGTYKVTPGVLIFDNGFVSKAWPNIRTGGYRQTTFLVDAATATNNPILTWKNGTATSTSGNYWYGGSHGGITISDQTGDTSANRHGLSLTGIWGCQFGYMRGVNLRADLVNIPANLYSGTDPDPYAVSFCTFQAIEAFNCVGWAIDNLNFVGMTNNTIDVLYVSGGTGGWFGLGDSNTCIAAAMQNMAGRAFDDGCFLGHAGGQTTRFTLINAELDNCEYAFRFNACTDARIYQTRIIHRYQSAPNVAAAYWPLTAISLGGGTTPAVWDLYMQIIHRLESGGSHSDIGTFGVDLTNSGGNLLGIEVEQVLINETSGGGLITISDSDYYANLNANSQALLTNYGRIIADTRVKAMALAFGSGSTAVLNSGYGTSAAQVLFPSVQYNGDSAYASSTFTAPYTGQFAFRARFRLTMASGSQLRLGILQTGSFTGMAADTTLYQNSNLTQTYEISGVIPMTLGDTIMVVASQNTATSSITCDAGTGQGASNIFQVWAM